MVTVLAPRPNLTPAGAIGRSCARSRESAAPCCRRLETAGGAVARDDPVMHFYRNVDDMPGYAGVGLAPDAIPPGGAVPLENAVADLSGIVANSDARVERCLRCGYHHPRARRLFRVHSVKRTEAAASAGWLVLRLRVRRAGWASVLAQRTGRSSAERKSIAPSAEPQTVALRTPDLGRTANIVVFNEGYLASEVDIFEAGVLVRARRQTMIRPSPPADALQPFG